LAGKGLTPEIAQETFLGIFWEVCGPIGKKILGESNHFPWKHSPNQERLKNVGVFQENHDVNENRHRANECSAGNVTSPQSPKWHPKMEDLDLIRSCALRYCNIP